MSLHTSGLIVSVPHLKQRNVEQQYAEKCFTDLKFKCGGGRKEKKNNSKQSKEQALLTFLSVIITMPLGTLTTLITQGAELLLSHLTTCIV